MPRSVCRVRYEERGDEQCIDAEKGHVTAVSVLAGLYIRWFAEIAGMCPVNTPNILAGTDIIPHTATLVHPPICAEHFTFHRLYLGHRRFIGNPEPIRPNQPLGGLRRF